jgi:alpha-galactosidase
MQGFRLGPLQTWVRPLADGSKAVALFNFVTDDVPQPITVRIKDLGFTGPVHARDLWSHKDIGILRDSYTAIPPKGGVVMLRVWQ